MGQRQSGRRRVYPEGAGRVARWAGHGKIPCRISPARDSTRSPDGIRTRATALRGRRARPLHNGALARRSLTPSAGVLGLEPRLTEPESGGLPITPYPCAPGHPGTKMNPTPGLRRPANRPPRRSASGRPTPAAPPPAAARPPAAPPPAAGPASLVAAPAAPRRCPLSPVTLRRPMSPPGRELSKWQGSRGPPRSAHAWPASRTLPFAQLPPPTSHEDPLHGSSSYPQAGARPLAARVTVQRLGAWIPKS